MLSAQDLERFHQDGIIGPFRLFAAEEVEGYQRLVGDLFGSHGVRLQTGADKREHNRHLTNADLRDLVTRPALAARMAAILGDDCQLWRTHFWCKEPGGAEIPWHQDWHYWPLEPVVVVSAWIALVDVDAENACMQVIPGSHRRLVPHVPSRPGVAFPEAADPQQVPHTMARDVALRAGEFVLFNERLLHGSPVNRSSRPRWGLAVRGIASLVRVLRYDAPDHVVLPLGGGRDRFGFNRLGSPTAESAAISGDYAKTR